MTADLVRITDLSGAVVYPTSSGSRATFNAWHVHLAADPDLRAKRPFWASVARDLIITRGVREVPFSVAMGMETQAEHDARVDDHPGDDDPRIADGWS